jgi:hypothetical protein
MHNEHASKNLQAIIDRPCHQYIFSLIALVETCNPESQPFLSSGTPDRLPPPRNFARRQNIDAGLSFQDEDGNLADS